MSLEVLNPATGRPIATLERAGVEEVDRGGDESCRDRCGSP